ncbi:Kelch repeat-containing protein 2 [Choanephora cucurbitarum]|uniref:Kelch repeat-containing protein 2 n=1 Tax=Choanephora cucurbitarum TaxID=101091 RepID=A0A1C7N2Q5_9FUNG|nr:Kelch repeat-containing protein 2 [Choanephora cucurbitarum]
MRQRHCYATRLKTLLLYLLLLLTWFITDSFQQECNQPLNFSDFTIVLVDHSIVVTGGNLKHLEVWSKDLSDGLDIHQVCWSQHLSYPTDTYLPYKNGIGFSLSNTTLAIQAGDTLATSALSHLSFFDLNSNRWSTPSCQGLSPSPRARMSVSLNRTEHVAYFYGGRTERTDQLSEYFNAFYSFNLNTLTWEWPKVLYSGGYRPARYGHNSHLISERLFIVGGKTAVYTDDQWVTSPGDFQSILIYDTAHQQAVNMATMGTIPPSLYSFSSVNAPDGKSIVLFGGQHTSAVHTVDMTSAVYVLDTCSLNWSQPIIQGTPPVARAGHEAIVYQERYMIVMLGIQDYQNQTGPVYVNDMAILDMISWTWIDSIPPLNQIPSLQIQSNCAFVFPVVVPDDNDSDSSTPFDPIVVSNTDRSPTTKQLALGITFGVLGFLLLFTASVMLIMRLRRDVDAKQNPRWISSVFSKKSSC